MTKYSILFVCTDNLCRSPTAEVVLRQKIIQENLADWVHVESAATHDFNGGEPVDIRVQKHAIRREYDLSKFRARLIEQDDFERFDLILAMEESNLLTMRMRCAPKYKDKLHYFTEYCKAQVAQDVPDPFYGKSDDFEHLLDLVEDASEGLVQHVSSQVTPNS
ncbi:MAG: low molecular weight phosphotyrosine protein phosphatase [Gallionella sp.]|nr:low molecular weight phosphotyrosine protein phosphatase [Gallionella sp.]